MAKKECSSQVFLHFSSYFAYIGPLHEIRVKVDYSGQGGPPVEKKVTERPSRVGIVSKSWFPRTRPDLPHRVWVAEGWSSAPAWVSADDADGCSRETTVRERAPVQASGRTTTRFFCWGHPAPRPPGLQLLPGNYQKTPGDPTKDVGLRRPVQGALLQTHRCAASLIPIWGGTPMWVTLRDQIWSKI